MNVIIFADIENKKLLQQILNWGSTSHIKFQMYFTMKNAENILKEKVDVIIATTKFQAAVLKEAGYKCILWDKEIEVIKGFA